MRRTNKKSRSGSKYYEKAKKFIPGGTQLLSKRPENILPGYWPSFYESAKGCEIRGMDGRSYVDLSYGGIGACILGYADPDVDNAVINSIQKGVATTLNCPEEVELAELLSDIHPWADKVRYARSGGEAMAIAVRISRAYSGKDKIIFCGYHGWSDWYLAANISSDEALDPHLLQGLEPRGVPKGLEGTALPFRYNELEELQNLLEFNQGDVAAVVMEPTRYSAPKPGFLEGVKDLAKEHNAVLVFDEITTGFRECPGGIHLKYGVYPDIAVFAKSISNGYAMSVVLGTSDVMEAAQSTFISSTSWTERIGPTAALATIKKHIREDVSTHLRNIGTMYQEAVSEVANMVGFPLVATGIPALTHVDFKCEDPLAVRGLFTKKMLSRGYLSINLYYAMYAHREEHILAYADCLREVLEELMVAIDTGTVREVLKGNVPTPGFQRLT